MEVNSVREVCVEAHYYRHKGYKHHFATWVRQYTLSCIHVPVLYCDSFFFSRHVFKLHVRASIGHHLEIFSHTPFVLTDQDSIFTQLRKVLYM